MTEAEELPSSSMFELVANDEVKKLGMVCALPPKPLLVRQVTDGGWAALNGVQLGDKLLEVNGSPALEMSAEELKSAMGTRPLSFRFMRPVLLEPTEPTPTTLDNAVDDTSSAKAQDDDARSKFEGDASLLTDGLAQVKAAEDVEFKAEEVAPLSSDQSTKSEVEEKARQSDDDDDAPKVDKGASVKNADDAESDCFKAESPEDDDARSKFEGNASLLTDDLAQVKAAEDVEFKAEEVAPLSSDQSTKSEVEEKARQSEDDDNALKADKDASVKSADDAESDCFKAESPEVAPLSSDQSTKSELEEKLRQSEDDDDALKADKGASVKSADDAESDCFKVESPEVAKSVVAASSESVGFKNLADFCDAWKSAHTPNMAAVKIQSLLRGRRVRKTLVTHRQGSDCAENIDCASGFCEVWKGCQSLEVDAAAVTIQKNFRGRSVRKSLSTQHLDANRLGNVQQVRSGEQSPRLSDMPHGQEVEEEDVQQVAACNEDMTEPTRVLEDTERVQRVLLETESDTTDTARLSEAATAIQRTYRGSVVREELRQASISDDSLLGRRDESENIRGDTAREDFSCQQQREDLQDDVHDDSDSTSARNYDEEPGSCCEGTEEDDWSSQLDREKLGVACNTSSSLGEREEYAWRGVPGFSLDYDAQHPEEQMRAPRGDFARAASKNRAQSQDTSTREGYISDLRATPTQIRGHSADSRCLDSLIRHEPSDDEDEDDVGSELTYGDASALPSQFGMSMSNDGSEGTSALDNFRTELLQKEHGFVRAWRKLIDISGSGRVTFAEFCEACRRIGFRGSIRDIWRQLDDVGSGGVSLQDLDPGSAHALGRFHSALVARYGGVRVATKALGLSGARKLKEREFCGLLRSHGIMPKHEASDLFRLLCLYPAASSLDRKAGISARDFEWLENASRYLPVVMPDRVHSGFGDDSLSVGSRPGSWFYDMSESLHSESEDDMESNCSNTVFDKLYQNALDHKERRRDYQYGQVMETESRGPVDPHRFERLHNEWRVKREEQERLVEDHFRQQFPQDGPRYLSQEVWDRINQPKQSVASDASCRSDLLDNYSSAQLRTACEKEGFSCKGKSREDLIELLKLLKQPDVPRTTAPKMTQRTADLYNDHKRRLAEQEERRLKAEQDKEMEIQALQMKPSSAPTRGVHHRLYAEAEVAKQRKQEESERAAAEREAALVQPARPPANPMTFERLYLNGVQREAKVSEKKRQLELEAEWKLKEASVHRNKTADPLVFKRLYNKVRRGCEAELIDETGQSEPLEDMRSASERDEGVRFDPTWQQKGAARPSRDELNQMLRKKIERVETAQRTALASKGGSAPDPVGPPGIIKRGPTPTPSLNGDRDSTSLRAVASRRQGQASQAELQRRKEVAFRCRESLIEYSVGSSGASERVERYPIMHSEIGMMRDFAKFLFGCFPTVEVAADAFDLYKTDRLSVAAFLAGCKRIRFHGDAKTVFRALDVDNVGFIGKREFQVLNRFHPQPTVELDAPEPFPLATSSKGRRAPPDSATKSVSSGNKTKSVQNASASAQRALKPSGAELERADGQRRCGLGEFQRCGPGESHVQPAPARTNAVSSAYPHKGGRSKVPSSAGSVDSEQSLQSRIPAPKAGQSQRQAASKSQKQTDELSSELLEHCVYPYKGCVSDIAEHWDRQPLAKTRSRTENVPAAASSSRLAQERARRQLVSSSSAPSLNAQSRREAATRAALEVEDFAEYSHAQLPMAASRGRSDGGRVNRPDDMFGKLGGRAVEAPLACDDELLELDSLPSDYDYEDHVSPSSRAGYASSRGSPQLEHAPHHYDTRMKEKFKALDKVSGAAVDSSTESDCSTPRSADSESLPWQEGPRSSVASSASGAPWQEKITPTTKTTHASNVFSRPPEKRRAPDDGEKSLGDTQDLKAEVRQMLQQYSGGDNIGDGPEAGLMRRRHSKDSSGPELSSKSAWIHPDQLASLRS